MKLPKRMEAKITRQRDGCWLWQGARDRGGYGAVGGGVVGILGRTLRAHRVVYELLVGPIPEGLQIDHLCRVRHCVNPAHLEPVTARENIRRGMTGEATRARAARVTRCPKGHPYDAGNTFRYGNRRYCRECRRIRKRLARARSLTTIL